MQHLRPTRRVTAAIVTAALELVALLLGIAPTSELGQSLYAIGPVVVAYLWLGETRDPQIHFHPRDETIEAERKAQAEHRRRR